jgi:hypothetical protein
MLIDWWHCGVIVGAAHACADFQNCFENQSHALV